MIVVTVEVWPSGGGERRRVLRAEIWNTGGSDHACEYHYRVEQDDAPEATGKVFHNRSMGAVTLVQTVLEDAL